MQRARWIALTGTLCFAYGCTAKLTRDADEQQPVASTTTGGASGHPVVDTTTSGSGAASGGSAGSGASSTVRDGAGSSGTSGTTGGTEADASGGTGGDTGTGAAGGSAPAASGGSDTGDAGAGNDGETGGNGNPTLVDCPDVGLDASVIHYVCDCQPGAADGCVAGDDAARGTVDAPWRTVEQARRTFQSATAGSTIAFCRGGSFDANGGTWVNENKTNGCTASEPCVVRDYGAGDAGRPVLTVSSGHGIDLENGGSAEHEEGYVFLNLDVRSTSGGSSGDGVFVYNDVDDVLVCNSSFDGFQVGFYLAGSNEPAAGSDGKNSRIELRSSSITNSGSQGILGSCDDCVVAYNTFENNGYAAASVERAPLNHNVYLSAHTLVRGMKVIDNQLYRSTNVDGACRATSLVAHGLFDDLVIEGNVIREDVGAVAAGCWGLSVDPGYGDELEAFTNVKIRRNTVVNTGNVAIGTSSCDGCTIENNLVIQEQPFDTTLIAVPVRARGQEDQPTSNVTVRNNTLVDLSSASITGVALGGEGTGHASSGNAIFGNGGGTLSCFAYGLGDSSYGVRDDNLCFVASGTLRWAGGAALAAFQSVSGADGNSVSLDPRFVSTAEPFDFHPLGDSPLIDGASAKSPADDLEGKARDARPDIGALER